LTKIAFATRKLKFVLVDEVW